MSAAFERCFQENLHHIPSFFFRNEPSGKGKDIGVVVKPRQAGDLFVPAQRRPDVRVFVGHHLGAVPAPADDDTKGINAIIDPFRQRMDKIGIIDTLRTIGAKIFYLISIFQ